MSIKNDQTDAWQGLMDKAYARWNDENDAGIQTYEDMIKWTAPLERMAVLLGNLNYQVNNGGFSQWIFNRYADHYKDVLYALDQVNTPNTETVKELIKAALDLNERQDKIEESYNDEDRYWEDEDEDTVMSGLRDEWDALDNRFYAIHDKFEEDVAKFFLDKMAEEAK